MSVTRTVVVRKGDGVRDFEQHMCDVLRGETVLRVPQTISYAGSLGRSVSLAQMIATWATCPLQPRALTTLSADGDTNHERFVSRLHGLAVAYYATSIIASDGITDLRQTLLNAATPRIIAMSEREFAKTSKGLLAELVFVHHAQHQFHSSAYKRTPALAEVMDPQIHGELIVSPREMNALVINILKALNLKGRDFVSIDPLLNHRDSPLGQLLHETFRNTAEHAYLDLKGRIPSKGLRCILIAPRMVEPSALQPTALVSREHPQLRSYFRSLRKRATQGRRRHVFILELSVFDTGPGFADTIQHQDTDDAIRVSHCFYKHASSKPGPNSGLGLGRVLRLVHELSGFVRFRTSTTEAFFSSHMEWSPDSEPIPHIAKDLPNAIGTALTIGVPLAR